MALKVKRFKAGFGITDGNLWFYHYYQSKAVAESVLPSFTPERVRVNISYPEPLELFKTTMPVNLPVPSDNGD